jgi:hypothetical protein
VDHAYRKSSANGNMAKYMTMSTGSCYNVRSATRRKMFCVRAEARHRKKELGFYLTRGRGNIYPTDDYIIEHVMLANMFLSEDCGQPVFALHTNPPKTNLLCVVILHE